MSGSGTPVFVFIGTAPFFLAGMIAVDAGWGGFLFVTIPCWTWGILLWSLYVRARIREGLVKDLGYDPGRPKRGFGFGFLLGFTLPLLVLVGIGLLAKSGVVLPELIQTILVIATYGPFGGLLLVISGVAMGFVWSMLAKTSSKEIRRLLAENRDRHLQQHRKAFGDGLDPVQLFILWMQEKQEGKTTLDLEDWKIERGDPNAIREREEAQRRAQMRPPSTSP